jgi:hypothetical protein
MPHRYLPPVLRVPMERGANTWVASRHGDHPAVAREAPALAAAPDGQVYIFGGSDGVECSTETFCYDPATDSLEPLRTSGIAPPPLHYTTLTWLVSPPLFSKLL